MQSIIPAVALLIGIVLGVLAAWWLFKRSIPQSIELATAQSRTEMAGLTERLQSREQSIDELRTRLLECERGATTIHLKADELESNLNKYTRAYGVARQTLEDRERTLGENRVRIEGLEATIGIQRSRAEAAEQDLATVRQALLSEQNEHEECRERLSDCSRTLTDFQQQHTQVTADLAQCRAELESEKKAAEEKLIELRNAEERLQNVFKALAADVLSQNNASFMALAQTQLEKMQESSKGELEKRHHAIEESLKPVKESMQKVDEKIQELERARAGAYSGLTEQVRNMMDMQKDLRSETSNLVRALRTPNVRGRWGEVQLRRVVEISGMVEHCDFWEQTSASTEDGKVRPDLLVRLPGSKNIVVDSKAPLLAYLNAIECEDDEQKKAQLKDHARQLKNHIEALGKKAYFEQFQPSPDFVILFLPGEPYFYAALAHEPELIEFAIDRNVVIATPTTLIAILRAIAFGWRQENLAQNAKEISDLGRELYKRCSTLGSHFAKVGDGLKTATDAYNRAVGSLEGRVLVAARKFEALGAAASDDAMIEISTVEVTPRSLHSPELISSAHSTSQALMPE